MAGPQVQGLILEGRVTPKQAERQCRLCAQDGKQGPPAARQSAPQPSGRNIRPACSGLVPRGCFSDDVLERIPACAVAVLWGMRNRIRLPGERNKGRRSPYRLGGISRLRSRLIVAITVRLQLAILVRLAPLHRTMMRLSRPLGGIISSEMYRRDLPQSRDRPAWPMVVRSAGVARGPCALGAHAYGSFRIGVLTGVGIEVADAVMTGFGPGSWTMLTGSLTSARSAWTVKWPRRPARHRATASAFCRRRRYFTAAPSAAASSPVATQSGTDGSVSRP